MKKIIQCFVYSLLLMGVISCGSDDDQLAPNPDPPSSFDYPTEGLLAYFPFDGDWEDAYQPAIDVAFTQAAAPTFKADKDGEENAAIFFSGVGEFLILTFDSFSSQDGFTIATFVRNETETSVLTNRFLEERSSSLISMNARTENFQTLSAAATFGFENDPNFTAKNFQRAYGAEINSWHHIAIAFNGINILRFYFDGVIMDEILITEGIEGTPVYPDYEQFVLGASLLSQQYFRGSLDELFFYNRELFSAEINQLFNR